MPVCGNYLFFELPKKIVLNPKDGEAWTEDCTEGGLEFRLYTETDGEAQEDGVDRA